MTRLRRTLLLFGVLGLLAFAAMNLIAYRQAHAMLHFSSGAPRTAKPESLNLWQKLQVILRGVNIPRPITTLPANVLGAECREVRIPSSNGITLSAWYCPAESDHGLVLLFHGYSSEKSGLRHEARALLDLGYSVLVVDFRGSGGSSESYTTTGYLEAEDVVAAVNFARANLAPARLILYGQSMGAAAALRAVSTLGVRPDAMIVEAVFDELLTTVRHRFEAMGLPVFPAANLLVFWGGQQVGFDGFAHRPVEYAAHITCPILFLHGSDDPRARIAEGRRVYAAVPGKKSFYEFAGSRHEPSVVHFESEWKSAVGDFLRESLSVPANSVGVADQRPDAISALATTCLG